MSPVCTSGQPLVPMIQLSDPQPSTPPLPPPMITLSAGTRISLIVRLCFGMHISSQDVTEPRWLSKSLWRNHNVAASGTAPRIGLHMGLVPCSVHFTVSGLQILTAKPQGCDWHLNLNNSFHTVKEYYVEHKT